MKKLILLISALLITSTSTFAENEIQITAKEKSEIFKVAGFTKTKNGWKGDCSAGEISIYEDLNNDGLKDAVIFDSGLACYGGTGVGYYIISQQKNGSWKKIFDNSGIPIFLKTKGKDGWPDIENGGPGFCFAVFRWNGQEYDVDRYEYEGKTCSIM